MLWLTQNAKIDNITFKISCKMCHFLSYQSIKVTLNMFLKLLSKPIVVFIITFLVIALPLFLFPINLFPGEAIQQIGSIEQPIKIPLSLSYFIGIGYEPQDLEGIKDFYLLPQGYALAFCFLIGFPVILAFRVHIARKNK
jgi:hypothetical protein